MKKVIAGRVYNTETAIEICEIPCNSSGVTDFRWHETSLYRTKNGNYFLAGEGNAMSMWSEPCGDMTGSGSGIRPITKSEARDYAEVGEIGLYRRSLTPEEMLEAGFELTEA